MARNVDVYTGTLASLPNPDALQEFSVVSSSFDSEYGRSAGSLVSAVIKSGTNSYHGSAYDYLRNDVMDAHQFFFGGTFLPKNPLKQNQFGASLGGPIKRDKSFLFFFLGIAAQCANRAPDRTVRCLQRWRWRETFRKARTSP